MKQHLCSKSKDAQIISDSFFAIQKDWQALYERLVALARFEARRDSMVRPVAPDEPDTEYEVGYSLNALEPLTIVYHNRKVKLTEKPYLLFRYVYDLYRTEEQTEFEFAELSAVITGNESGMKKLAIWKLIRKLTIALEKIKAPIVLYSSREVLYVGERESISEQQELDLMAGEEKIGLPSRIDANLNNPPVKRRSVAKK